MKFTWELKNGKEIIAYPALTPWKRITIYIVFGTRYIYHYTQLCQGAL